ncbi:hypothetical protein HDU93_000724 [Gonapodya sp. JEL0774]|nr:hypothetical protein HDU93_000724 [Gonapodya sp. JEL0774]
MPLVIPNIPVATFHPVPAPEDSTAAHPAAAVASVVAVVEQSRPSVSDVAVEVAQVAARMVDDPTHSSDSAPATSPSGEPAVDTTSASTPEPQPVAVEAKVSEPEISPDQIVSESAAAVAAEITIPGEVEAAEPPADDPTVVPEPASATETPADETTAPALTTEEPVVTAADESTVVAAEVAVETVAEAPVISVAESISTPTVTPSEVPTPAAVVVDEETPKVEVAELAESAPEPPTQPVVEATSLAPTQVDPEDTPTVEPIQPETIPQEEPAAAEPPVPPGPLTHSGVRRLAIPPKDQIVPGKFYVAKRGFITDVEGEVAVNVKDILTIERWVDGRDGWVQGQNVKTKQNGMFPAVILVRDSN